MFIDVPHGRYMLQYVAIYDLQSAVMLIKCSGRFDLMLIVYGEVILGSIKSNRSVLVTSISNWLLFEVDGPWRHYGAAVKSLFRP